MKNFNFCVIVAALIACVLAKEIKGIREEKCGDDLSYSVEGGTLTIQGTGEMYDYTSSSHPPWWGQRSSITTIMIDDGVTYVGKYAFHNCQRATELIIGSTVRTIPENAFNGCGSLTSVTIPSSVASLAGDAFINCYKLASIEVQQGNDIFASLDGILINNQTKTIVRCPQGSTVSSFTIPDYIKTIGENAFSSCNNLVNVFIPLSVETISRCAFFNCKNLVDVVIPSSVTTIAMQAFYSCESLENVTVPASVTTLYSGAFSCCPSLTAINVEPANPYYYSIDGVLFDADDDSIMDYPMGKKDEVYIVPSRVKRITESSFNEIIFLKAIVIPESVTSISSRSIRSCDNLTSVFYQGSSIISTSVFEICRVLKNICVSPYYDGERFGGMKVSTSEICESFKGKFDGCYLGSYEDGNVTAVKREGVAEWEENSNHCYEYQCNRITGAFESWKRQNATEWEDQSQSDHCYEYQCVNETGPVRKEIGNVTEWEKQSNHCYEYMCNPETGAFESRERENATVWEHRSDSCIQYQCDNKTGTIYQVLCYSTDTINRVCVGGQCLDNETFFDKECWVVIDMDGVGAMGVNSSDLMDSIAGLSGVSKDESTLGIRFSEDGFILSIILNVDNEETAKKIANAINGIVKGEECEYGVLCFATRAAACGDQSSDESKTDQSSESKTESMKEISKGYQTAVGIFCLMIMTVFTAFV